MEFKALDKDFNLLGVISPSNVQWNRKYYESGDFLIQMTSNQYRKDMKYIYTQERDELGMVQKVSWQGEKMVEISGFFMEKVLNDKIIYPTFYGSGEITAVLAQMINEYKKDIPIEVNVSKDNGDKIDFQSTGDELGKKLYEILQTQEMSYKVIYDYLNNKIHLTFYKGEDKTQDSGGDTFVTFSTSWDNLNEPVLDIDESNYKNYFVVAGTGEADERITVNVDLSNGGYRKEAFIDERNTKYNPSEQTLDQYKLELQQKGLEKALDYKILENISFKIKPQGYTYLVDYDLGTKCDCMINELGLTLQIRVIAIHEVFKEGKHEIEIEIGTPIKSNAQLRQ